MQGKTFARTMTVLIAAASLSSTVLAAPPPCGKKNCRDIITDICGELSGRARSQCSKQVIDACKQSTNESMCTEETTTTTTQEESSTTTTSTTSTTTTTEGYGSPSRAFTTRAADLLD